MISRDTIQSIAVFKPLQLTKTLALPLKNKHIKLETELCLQREGRGGSDEL